MKPASTAFPPMGKAFDYNEALERLSGDEEFFSELAGILLRELPQWMELLRRAAENRDAVALREHAHTLKGAVGNFSAPGVHAAALALELLGKYGTLDQVDQAYLLLDQEVLRLTAALQPFVVKNQS